MQTNRLHIILQSKSAGHELGGAMIVWGGKLDTPSIECPDWFVINEFIRPF